METNSGKRGSQRHKDAVEGDRGTNGVIQIQMEMDGMSDRMETETDQRERVANQDK